MENAFPERVSCLSLPLWTLLTGAHSSHTCRDRGQSDCTRPTSGGRGKQCSELITHNSSGSTDTSRRAKGTKPLSPCEPRTPVTHAMRPCLNSFLRTPLPGAIPPSGPRPRAVELLRQTSGRRRTAHSHAHRPAMRHKLSRCVPAPREHT